ncbi:rho/rac/cdc gtpase-activating protein [Anaeramoeba ignava]|uniref:Rho/rac/cdc gtpase-activating protein n=1 Tax=Anaeramoeba ignava TaxID=1746090 RepID=A0A9Q0LCX7_ANAIG|nr:rho/rac/cdc gtpase-activating protein [Anaeramoeba ignava]|eukprot:Anaeramoba_ignava/a347387_252.p1 GENE.a347387_252~~a347387_252.p1  ORF type:complete len:345 (+),score=95.56 a347387_252:66-1100(+)
MTNKSRIPPKLPTTPPPPLKKDYTHNNPPPQPPRPYQDFNDSNQSNLQNQTQDDFIEFDPLAENLKQEEKSNNQRRGSTDKYSGLTKEERKIADKQRKEQERREKQERKDMKEKLKREQKEKKLADKKERKEKKEQEKREKKKKKEQKDKGKEAQDNEDTKVFGVPLMAAIGHENRSEFSPPSIIEKSIMYLEEKAKFEEGIYRLTGNVREMNELKEAFDRGEDVDLAGIRDENTVASLIKLYFRELPEPIFGDFTDSLYDVSSLENEDRILALRHIYNSIPEVNKAVLRWLLPHLDRVQKQSYKNKMTPENLAIVFAPTLHIPTGLLALMITNWADILCPENN